MPSLKSWCKLSHPLRQEKKKAARSDITSRHAPLPCEPCRDPAPPDPAITCPWAHSFLSLPLAFLHLFSTADLPICAIPFSCLISLLRSKPRWNVRTRRWSNKPCYWQDGTAGRGHRAAQGGFPWPLSEQSLSGARAKTGSYSAVKLECKQARLGTEIGQRERLHAGYVPETQKGRAGRCPWCRREEGKGKK